MTTNESAFYVLRYSLTKEKQENCFSKKLPSPKGSAIEVAIMNDREWTDKGTKFSFVGFRKSSVNNSETRALEQNIYIGKLARLKITSLGGKVPGDIVNYDEDDWIPIIVIFDTIQQFIFVQKSSKFYDAKYICRKIEKGLLDPIISEYNYNIFVEPMPIKGRFWDVVDKHKRIYELDMVLISPNILQTNQKARKALENLQDLYSQDKTEIKMKSKSGSLEVPRNPIENYIEYIEEGEGEWKVKVDENGNKKIITSSDLTETINLPVDKKINEVFFDNQYQLNVTEEQPNNINKINRLATSLADRILLYVKRRNNE